MVGLPKKFEFDESGSFVKPSQVIAQCAGGLVYAATTMLNDGRTSSGFLGVILSAWTSGRGQRVATSGVIVATPRDVGPWTLSSSRP